jgi:diguanylate cyclase (GGDEF)-like protein
MLSNEMRRLMNTTSEDQGITTEPEDRVEQLQRELESLEGRDFEVWAMGGFISLAVVGTLFIAIDPQLIWNFRSFLQSSNSAPELILGLFTLVLLLNAYLYYERRLIRASRRELLRQLIIIERTAQIDPLTGAFNRRCLDQLLRREISRAQRKGSSFSMLLIDVNSFKLFNSRFGHLYGDRVLSEVANVLSSAVRASDVVVRYGGDEFIVLLADTDGRQAEVAVRRIHDYLAAWNVKSKHPMAISVACGIGQFSEGMSAQDLIKIADEEMFSNKNKSAKEVEP